MRRRLIYPLLLLALLCGLGLRACAEPLVTPLTPRRVPGTADGGPAPMHLGPTGQFPALGITLDTTQHFTYFGEADCWLLVGTDDPGTIGWIAASAATLPEAIELLFPDAMPASLQEDATLTANPLDDAPNALFPLSAGTEVLLLAQLGDWGYVQTTLPDTTPVRAFLPLSALL